MKKIIWYVLEILLVLTAAVLVMISPDAISVVLTVVMAVLVIAAMVFGMMPLVRYSAALRKGQDAISQAVELKPEAPWIAVLEMNQFFGHAGLDKIFEDYKQRVQQQRKAGIAISNISDVINEEYISLKTWQGVIQQIPGTLTGLGILGSFVGMLFGVKNLGFATMEAAIESIQILLSGIGAAFYTSIAGVILSILFNILYKILWSSTIRECDLFTSEFQRNVIPPEEEQFKFRQKKELQQIVGLLERLPEKGEFAVSDSKSGAVSAKSSESALLMQVREGIKNHEFTFYLQPRFDLNTRSVTGAEALVRWNHPKMGLITPSVFINTIENNGYITKLDGYMWDLVCKTLRRWIDSGNPIVPISINISKTDILAMDVAEVLRDIVQKYRIPPRYIEVDIEMPAYLEAANATLETENALRQEGYRVLLDGFDGDFMELNSVGAIQADAYKLDMRKLKEYSNVNITALLNQASRMNVRIEAEGIENMEQMSTLRKSGCNQGQGYYLSRPMSIESFEKEISKG